MDPSHVLRTTVKPLALAVSLFSVSHSASADFWDDVDISFSSTFSIGASWRAEDRDPSLVAGGNIAGNTDFSGNASSSTADDGNLNYDKGDAFSRIFKGRHDLSMEYDNVGAFVRFRYWYDDAIENDDVLHGNALNNYAQNEPLKDDDWEDLAKGSGFSLMDAYVYGTWDVGEVPVDLRLGKQVLSWGESTFIQNGVNSINPIDVPAIRKPGAELKDALLPIGMLYTSVGVTINTTIEAFVAYEWEQTQLDGCGTLFSTADLAVAGCDKLTLYSLLNPASDQTAVNEQGSLQLPYFIPTGYLERAPDKKPSDTGQYGVAVRYYAEELNGSEFGFYYLNTHYRTPFFSVQAATDTQAPQYYFAYPEDVEIFGISFNTTAAGWAISGEISHRPDMPLQLNTTDLVQPAASALAATWSPLGPQISSLGAGEQFDGFETRSFTQLQFTFVNFFDRVLGASTIAFVTEVGFDWLDDIEEGIGVTRFDRSPTYGAGVSATCDTSMATSLANINTSNCTDDGFLTDFSWGYRMRAVATYADAFAGVNLKPGIAWSHDVSGFGPAPNFQEGLKTLSLSLNADYLNRYTAGISYTQYSGGDYSTITDKDFYSIQFGYSF